jgi:two-component sensor histidine kinase
MNNELASAISMLSRAAARSTHVEAKMALAKVMDRLQSFSIVHRALQMPERSGDTDASAYLRRLCLAISQSKLDGRNVKLVLADSPLRLRAEQCWLLGMIVNELITNAVRHAFDEAGGEVRVEVVTSGQMVECRISDNGTAREDMRPGRGLGIVRELSKALAGGIAHRFGRHGSVAVLTFPPQSRGDCMMQPFAPT